MQCRAGEIGEFMRRDGRRIGARPLALVFQPVRKMPTIKSVQVARECRIISEETSKMPRRPILLASAATLVLTLAAPASAQLLQHKDLSLYRRARHRQWRARCL
jgi:hypothetical protein